MKANQFVKDRDDEAVSPVIAVILMVAITVVLAATVYVWVSGFGSSANSSGARSLSLTSAGALASGEKGYTVASASQSMKYSELAFTINGATFAIDTTGGDCATTPAGNLVNKYIPCRGTTDLAGTAIVTAGDVIWFKTVAQGNTLRVLDTNGNSVLLTLTIG